MRHPLPLPKWGYLPPPRLQHLCLPPWMDGRWDVPPLPHSVGFPPALLTAALCGRGTSAPYRAPPDALDPAARGSAAATTGAAVTPWGGSAGVRPASPESSEWGWGTGGRGLGEMGSDAQGGMGMRKGEHWLEAHRNGDVGEVGMGRTGGRGGSSRCM